jgi:hypothetical protein
MFTTSNRLYFIFSLPITTQYNHFPQFFPDMSILLLNLSLDVAVVMTRNVLLLAS